jgi:hypothetical protein
VTTFAGATAVARISADEWAADLHPAFAIGGTKPNGGYLVATLARAALAAAAEAGATQQHVVGAGVQYLASPDIGPARIRTQVLRVGRTASQVAAWVDDGDRPGVLARFTLGHLPEGGEPFWGAVTPVDLPPIDDCDATSALPERGITVAFDPATTFRSTADGIAMTGGGELRAWFRDDSAPQLDSVALLYAADVLPPATFAVVQTGWVPTLDLTVYVRALPVPGPIRLRFRAGMIQDGFADEVCEGWDSAGRLVLQSTQLAALRLPG